MKYFLSIFLGILLMACTSVSSSTSELFFHEWQLVAIDNTPLPDGVKVTFQINDEGRISGLAGCNRFFGPIKLTDTYLEGNQLATTMMACDQAREEVERIVLALFNEGAEITHDGDNLILTNKQHSLQYKK